MTDLHAAQAHDIRELQRTLERTGVDNYTHAVCRIALGEDVDFEGLTQEEKRRLAGEYGVQDEGSPEVPCITWTYRNKAIRDALDAAWTDEGLSDQDS